MSKVIRIKVDSHKNSFPVKFMQHKSEDGVNVYELHIDDEISVGNLNMNGKPEGAFLEIGIKLEK